LKLFIGSLLVFSLVILFLFALFPSDIAVSRVVQINRSPEEVLKHIADLREWKKWNEFVSQSQKEELTNTQQNHGTDSANIITDNVHIQLIKVHMDTVFMVWSRGDDSFAGNFILAESNLDHFSLI
jgi:hypothetical protein